MLEKSRDEQIGHGQKSDAYGRYRRLQSELAIDREMLGLLLSRRNETMVASAKKDTGARVLDAAVPPLLLRGPAPHHASSRSGSPGSRSRPAFGVACLLEML